MSDYPPVMYRATYTFTPTGMVLFSDEFTVRNEALAYQVACEYIARALPIVPAPLWDVTLHITKTINYDNGETHGA